MFGCCPKTRAGVLADHLLLAVILNTVVGCTALHYTKLYSFRLSCKMVSFTAANTNRIFSVSKMGKSIRTLYAIQYKNGVILTLLLHSPLSPQPPGLLINYIIISYSPRPPNLNEMTNFSEII